MDNLIPEDIIDLKADLERLIDFDQFIKDGVLSKKDSCYDVHDWKRFQEYAQGFKSHGWKGS
jgi:hypothetical protein